MLRHGTAKSIHECRYTLYKKYIVNNFTEKKENIHWVQNILNGIVDKNIIEVNNNNN